MTVTARRDGKRLAILARQGGASNVNNSLTFKARREVGDVGGAIRRMCRALYARAQDGDLEALTELYELRRDLAVYTASAAVSLHSAHGYTWFEIGRAAGMSRQAAQQKWGDG